MTERKSTGRKSPAKTVQGETIKALKAATWLTDADAATVQLAITLAKAIDDEGATAQIASRLLDTLKALGLTAVSRKELGIDKKREEGNPLDRIRSGGAGTDQRIANTAHLYAVKE
jgi:hypothetical protein